MASLLVLLHRSVTWLLGALIVVLIGLALSVSVLPRYTGIQVREVVSGSMQPAIQTGAMVVAVPASLNSLKPGDVIAFHQPDQPSRIITHRIVGIREDKGWSATTKGDANSSEDYWHVAPDDVLGKVWFSVPRLGYVTHAAATKAGFFVLLLAPSVVIAAGELRIWYRFIRYGALA